MIQLYSVKPAIDLPLVNYGKSAERQIPSISVRNFNFTEAYLVGTINKTDSILFTGDILLARNVEYLMNKYDFTYPYQKLDLETLADNPIIIGNFESAIPKIHKPTKMMMLDFSVNSLYLTSLKDSGFDYLSLANNHTYDFGEKDFLNTKEELESSEFTTLGHPKVFDSSSIEYIETKSKRVALISAHTLEKNLDNSLIETVLEEANTHSDLQILYIHWGNEYTKQSSLAQRQLAKRFIAAGIDLIIGHHPHVVQEIDFIDDVPVFYSLGNYIFDQYQNQEVQTGLVLHLDLKGDPTIHLFPTKSFLSQPKLMIDDDKDTFLKNLAAISASELYGYIAEGVVPLDRPVATSEKVAMMRK